MNRESAQLVARAHALIAENRIAEARDIYVQICAKNTADTGAWMALGTLNGRLGQMEGALFCFRRVVELAPGNAIGHLNMAKTLQARDEDCEAESEYRTALRLDPGLTEAWLNLGLLKGKLGSYSEAASCLFKVIERRPDDPHAHHILGCAFRELGELERAESCFRRAVDLDPKYLEAYVDLGVLLQRLGKLDECTEVYHRILDLKPDHALTYYNLGTVYKAQHRLEQAAENYQRAIQLQPDFADAHFSYAMVLLVRGDFARGWAEYEWRWGCDGWVEKKFNRPKWDGSELNGGTILLHSEQGFGDTIQFIRYASLVKKRGGRVLVLCQPELRRLVATCEGIEEVITLAPGSPLPHFDVHLPLLSLPAIFRTDLQSIPSHIPYLHVPEGYNGTVLDVCFSGCRRGLKVGIVWAGNPSHVADRQRSCTLEDFGRLAEIPGVNLFSLQKGASVADLARVERRGTMIRDLGSSLRDFLDTAAALLRLDLVITIDTSVAHLAGALGRPVWVLLPYIPDWRWLLTRENSPWYPSMRLFRQSASREWDSVFDKLRQLLREELESTARPPLP